MTADHLNKSARSENMRRIRSKNTKPELEVRSFLQKNGYRFRLHKKDLPGKPDIVLAKYKTVIFVHGCFWHQHKNCKRATTPSSNKNYWLPKLKRNQERFIEVKKALVNLKWRVIVMWECDINGPQTFKKTLINILKR